MASQKALRRQDLWYPELSYAIVGSAFDVYNELGSGHQEQAYQKALAEAFRRNGLQFREQMYLPLRYQGRVIGKKFLDFLVEGKIVVEIKKGDWFSRVHINQVLEYLKVSDLKLAMLINFGSSGVTFKRIVNFS